MAAYEIKLIDRLQEAEATNAYVFEKPEGFSFVAGQHVVIQVNAGTGKATDGIRTFTIGSSPTEDHVTFVMRMGTSPFKRFFERIQPGEKIKIFGPTGRFIFPDTAKPIVMIAGGIGIVPFRVFIKYVLDTKRSNQLTLLYSNPNVKRIAYKKEFDQAQETHSTQVAIINTLTQAAPEGWVEERGRISAQMIRSHVNDLSVPLFYICGSVQFVVDIEKTLYQELGIEKERIYSEKFTGH